MTESNQSIVATSTTTEDLLVKTGDDFIAEFEVMNLEELKDKTFLVAVSTGNRNEGKFLSTTVHGPYDFYETCEQIGYMWREHQHHAKACILDKDRKKPVKYLDENTSDYLEAHFEDIIFEGILESAITNKEYTCKANILESNKEEDNPLLKQQVVEKTEE